MSENTDKIIANHSIGRGFIPADCACSHDHVFKSVNAKLPDLREEFPNLLAEGTVSMEEHALRESRIAEIKAVIDHETKMWKEPFTPVFQNTSGGRE